jgi:hypothetical protein
MPRLYAPRGLDSAGRRLWREVVAAHELTAGERVILTEACRAADLCERLNAQALRAHAPRSTLVELRQQRAALAALIVGLGV